MNDSRPPSSLVSGFPWPWQARIVQDLELDVVACLTSIVPDSPWDTSKIDVIDAVALISGDFPGGLEKASYLPDRFYFENRHQIDDAARCVRIRWDLYEPGLVGDDGTLRRRIYRELAYWTGYLQERKITLVLFESPPHLLHDLTLYYAAKNLTAVETVIIYRVGDPLRFFLATDLEDLVPAKEINSVQEKVPPISAAHGLAWYVQQEPPASAQPGSLKKAIIDMINFTRDPQLRDRWQRRQERTRQFRFQSSYDRLATRRIPGSNFLFFPLHESPEDTTYPSGWNFEDQIYAVEAISESLPDDWSVVIKEHPSQRYYRGRKKGFYSHLANLRGVVLADRSIKTIDLIKASRGVATVTGQAGWEGLTNGKPCLYLGQAWYQGAPGTTSLDEFRSGTLAERIAFLNQKVSLVELEKWLHSLYSRSFPGYVNSIVHRGEEDVENRRSVVTSMNGWFRQELEHLYR